MMCRREEESQEHTRARVLLVAWVDGWKMMLDGWMEGQLCVCSCPHAVNPLPIERRTGMASLLRTFMSRIQSCSTFDL